VDEGDAVLRGGEGYDAGVRGGRAGGEEGAEQELGEEEVGQVVGCEVGFETVAGEGVGWDCHLLGLVGLDYGA
jgi:hypothetical protein